jgi:apolipoprotein D and lipocalin family protein
MPEGVQAVADFDAERYLGRWYEIARLDHSFERNLVNVTAEYSRREDGAVRVRNRGFDTEDNEWSDIEGVARFVGDDDEGYLKVSFFGPFYGSYVVFELEREDYDYAFVSGFNRDYLWLLARTPTVSDALKAEFTEKAASLGFATDELIWVEHPPR